MAVHLFVFLTNQMSTPKQGIQISHSLVNTLPMFISNIYNLFSYLFCHLTWLTHRFLFSPLLNLQPAQLSFICSSATCLPKHCPYSLLKDILLQIALCSFIALLYIFSWAAYFSTASPCSSPYTILKPSDAAFLFCKRPGLWDAATGGIVFFLVILVSRFGHLWDHYIIY